ESRPAHRRRQALRHRRRVRPAHHGRGLRPLAARPRPVRGDGPRAGAAHQGPGLRPRARRALRPARRGRRGAAHGPRHRGPGPRPGRGRAAGARARRGDRPAHVRQVRDAPAPHEPRAALPADRPARRARGPLSRDGQAALGLGRALHPSRPDPGGGRLLRPLRRRARDGPAAHGRAGVLRRLPQRRGRPLPERDPPLHARVARRGVHQGHRAGRPGARGPRPPHRRGPRRAGALHRPGLPRPRDGPGHHGRQHALRRGLPGARVRRPARALLSRAHRADGVRGGRRAPRRAVRRGPDLHPLLLAARARRGARADRARHRHAARPARAPL
ncbi:MAG: protein of unknown function DUF201, partial [uncultured Solirubrobacteraceae bacterium]